MIQTLITRDDIAKYRQISKSAFDDKLKEQILDAQLIDLQPLIGERLYNKLMANPENFQDLLIGGAYEYNGETYHNHGLKMVISYFAYARHIMFSSYVDTPSGAVQIRKDNSEPIDMAGKKTIYQINRESALQIWDNVKNYLTRTNHPLFNNCKTSAPRSAGMRFTKLG
ncbi:hypothetical protein Q765_03320 [Flavobacterium rivuli WB 3.3-2 = DSM 21788]|uniref:Uncharacterized protein n=1 Tax=Flavobacterium rivuli WB 3.3-2 = DSM 21788 TaxID=1121895 RepID=A0A0A2M9J1_9FLAO|nr:hypothetical protein [Flavobacterium rivuli]KGO88098.1 hypothetical protein Q765_03320 [Flavobacterium rivuli WB 3.3-2 = DSM 21788]